MSQVDDETRPCCVCRHIRRTDEPKRTTWGTQSISPWFVSSEDTKVTADEPTEDEKTKQADRTSTKVTTRARLWGAEERSAEMIIREKNEQKGKVSQIKSAVVLTLY